MINQPTRVINFADVKFGPESRPRTKLKQYGSNLPSWYNAYSRPMSQRLREFEAIALNDTTVSYVLFLLIDTLLSLLGPAQHPDPEIQDFLRRNVENLGGLPNSDPGKDVNAETDTWTGSQLYQCLYQMIHCAMWAGYSTTEPLYKISKNSIVIEDFITYHPSTITVRPNRKGRLIENQDSADGIYRSGIYQTTGDPYGMVPGETQLPLWKTVHLTRSSYYGNYYGFSAMEPIYKWQLLKEALIDMQVVALDRSGTPIVAIVVPMYNTSETEIDPVTGEERALSSQELLERQITSQTVSGGGNVLLLPQVDEKMPPKAQVLSSGSNVGDSFEIGIDRCDREMVKGLFLPYTLFPFSTIQDLARDQHRPMELFNRLIMSMHRQYIMPIVSQSFHQLVKLNFTRDSAQIPPQFPIRRNTRPEDRVALMQMISGLTDRGYFNPTDSEDWEMVREMVDAPNRPQSLDDVEFVKTLLVYPRMPTEGAGGTTTPGRDRSSENKVKGKGAGAGRPIGTSAPKTNA